MLNAIIVWSLLAAAGGSFVMAYITVSLMIEFPDMRKRLLPIILGLILIVPWLLIGSIGRVSGVYEGPTLWFSAWGSMIMFFWFGVALPLVAWVHGDIRRKREKLKVERVEKINNGIKEQAKQGMVQ